jgi:hypothetical protein
MTSSAIDEYYQLARANGALGGEQRNYQYYPGRRLHFSSW